MSRSSAVSSSAVRLVGSIGGRSRPRSGMTASMSTSAGSAPRSRSGRDLARHVVGRRRHHQAQEGQARRLVEASGDAEVEQRHPPVGLHEEVAAVQVAVEHAVEHRPLEEGDERGVQHGLGVDAGRTHADASPQAKPLSRSITSTRRVTRVGWGRGTTMARLAGVGEHPGHVEHVLGLEAEVELLHDGLGEQLDEGRGIGQGGHGDAAHEQRGQPAHGGQVAPHEPGHVGALDLDHHRLAADQARRWTWAIEAAAMGSRANSLKCARAAAEIRLDDPRGRRRRTRPAPGRGTAGTRPRAPRGTALRPTRGSAPA